MDPVYNEKMRTYIKREGRFWGEMNKGQDTCVSLSSTIAWAARQGIKASSTFTEATRFPWGNVAPLTSISELPMYKNMNTQVLLKTRGKGARRQNGC